MESWGLQLESVFAIGVMEEVELGGQGGVQEKILGNELLQKLREQLIGSIFSVNTETFKIYDWRSVGERQRASC